MYSEQPNKMNSDPGTYALILKSPQSMSVCVGKAGTFEFMPGYYIYTGSARGPGGLKARVSRHLKMTKRCHWHIDYLTTRIPVIETWYSYNSSADECLWAAGLQSNKQKYAAISGLGASDCSCASHLFFAGKYPRLDDFTASLRTGTSQVFPGSCRESQIAVESIKAELIDAE